jgi:chromosome segregation ATPase
MCHANIKIPLHSRINFITGTNGSGKSAFVAAL